MIIIDLWEPAFLQLTKNVGSGMKLCSFPHCKCSELPAARVLCNHDTEAKLSQFKFKGLFFDDVVDLVLSGEITITLGIEVKSFAGQNTS